MVFRCEQTRQSDADKLTAVATEAERGRVRPTGGTSADELLDASANGARPLARPVARKCRGFAALMVIPVLREVSGGESPAFSAGNYGLDVERWSVSGGVMLIELHSDAYWTQPVANRDCGLIAQCQIATP